MTSASEAIFYVFIFFSVYVQVFFFVTFLENSRRIVIRREKIKLSKYGEITVVVPCWNEAKTVHKTVQSLLDLNYPKDKIQILLIDDGSTDDTWNILNQFSHYPNVKLFRKENGGKHTALNLGLENTNTEFFACLDADSIVSPESLLRIMSYFETDPSTMAVVPSLVVNNPKNIVQYAQNAEYYMGVFLKKMLGFLDAIHVTPGPFTVFRKKVFDDLGPYKYAHNTEDMEIAYRMQKNQYKIAHCNDADVYTNTPHTIGTLYRQRLRWIYGFINNTIDYRSLMFNKKYGNFSLFTLPIGLISIFSVGYFFGKIVYSIFDFIYVNFVKFGGLGIFPEQNFNFDPFFINIQASFILMIFIFSVVLFSILMGKRISGGKWGLSLKTLYFFPIFSVIAPFWMFSAIINTILSRTPEWR